MFSFESQSVRLSVTPHNGASAHPFGIIWSGWDGAARRSSWGSPSPLRSPAAYHCALRHARTKMAGFNGHRSSRACRGGSSFTTTPQHPTTQTCYPATSDLRYSLAHAVLLRPIRLRARRYSDLPPLLLSNSEPYANLVKVIRQLSCR
jgi:hypothetical protein